MRRLALAALAVATLGQSAFADDGPYLFSIPVEQHQGTDLDEAVYATLHVPNAERAARLIDAGGALEVMAAGENTVTVALGTRHTLGGVPDSADHGDTFVIDYSEAAVAKVVAEVRHRHGTKPTLAELTEFVFQHIDDKTYLASFDLASRVAATRAGDCTEHAVLLTALARATGHAARVTLGVLVVESSERVAAFGHAWSEIHDGKAWQVADATMPEDPEQVVRVRYLPLINLDNEGPGYAMDMARLAQLQPSRLSGIRNASGIETLH